MNKVKFRKKVRETTEKEWIEEALRAREFSAIETFGRGLKLIKFAIRYGE